jgi:HD superfamily phosphohydrolase
MTVNVYRHKVRLITDQMIVRSIMLGIEKDNIDALRKLYTFDNSEDFFHNYATYDDARFMQDFGTAIADSKCSAMLLRLRERRLLKRVFQMKTRDLAAGAREMVKALSRPKETTRRETIEAKPPSRIAWRLKLLSTHTRSNPFVSRQRTTRRESRCI